MRTRMQSSQDLPQFEAVALIEQRPEPNRIREEPEKTRDDQSFPLEEARRLAHAILRLDGLTGAEIEAAESMLSVDRAAIRRLLEIAGNHSLLTPEFFSLSGSGPDRQGNRTNEVRR